MFFVVCGGVDLGFGCMCDCDCGLVYFVGGGVDEYFVVGFDLCQVLQFVLCGGVGGGYCCGLGVGQFFGQFGGQVGVVGDECGLVVVG